MCYGTKEHSDVCSSPYVRTLSP